MKALFVHDTYYMQDPESPAVWSFGAFPYSLWAERFLPHFDTLSVIGREKMYASGDIAGHPRSDGAQVSFHLLPNINSPFKRLFSSKPVQEKIEQLVKAHDVVIIRGPVEFGMMAAAAARRFKIPYVVEMSGCAYDHTYYHGSLIGRLYAPIKFRRAKAMVRLADAVMYVTRHFLQERYPTKAHQAAASNVEIDMPDISVLERRLARIETYALPLRIGLIGNYGNSLKGVGVAIQALGRIKDNLPPFEFHILGKGDPNLWQKDIKDAGLQTQVYFDGVRPSGTAVLEWLDEVDFYIQPSFHEGLPRAMIEALSRGCPALASDAGGTDELLPPENIHRRGDVESLARRLECTLTDKDWMKQQAHLNFDTARLYTRDILAPIRQNFWGDVRKMISWKETF
ncbi:MAG: glycosyltransferase family 4 protein [Rhodospirillales bacterium]|nr:glycosyltransferase family 4 protein [Rhodospirillales bacterium]MCB9964687.1 glycosyltransferase family 4 protein [Rhodospirillales bacterium]MCB9979977.1 glycosyltransferase family 4 protein [Rhodospirillales bacterium]